MFSFRKPFEVNMNITSRRMVGKKNYKVTKNGLG